MAEKNAGVVTINFKDLREAVVALSESGLLKGLAIPGVDAAHVNAEGKMKLVGLDKEQIRKNFMKAVEAIPNNDAGKFPGPKVALDYYNSLVDAEEKATKDQQKATEKTAAKEKAPKEKKEKTPKEKKESGEPKVTKKSLVIAGVSKKGGSTIEEMAQACTDAGLGDLDLNKKIVGLWLKKLGIPVKKNDKGFWMKAE